MKIIAVSSLFLLAILSGCSSTKKQTVTQYTGKPLDQIFVIASTADLEARVRLEKEWAIAAEAMKLKVVKSIDVMPPSLVDPKPPGKDEFLKEVKASGAEHFLVLYYIKNSDSINYIKGEHFKGAEDGLGQLALQLMAGKNKGAVEYRDGPLSKDYDKSGYFSKGKKGFYLLTVLFTSEDSKIIYSDRSASFDDSELVPFSQTYMSGLLKHLQEEKFIR